MFKHSYTKHLILDILSILRVSTVNLECLDQTHIQSLIYIMAVFGS